MNKQKKPKQLPQQSVTNRVLDVVARGYDAAKIAHELAKQQPTLFLQLYEQTAPIQDWRSELIQTIYHGNKVAAIKALREKSGLGLMEAKLVVDHVAATMVNQGYMFSAPAPTQPLINGTDKLYKELVDVAYRNK